MKKNETDTRLKYPIELSTSPRDWDGSLLALANTDDGGESVVVWRDSSWVLTDAVSVSKVLSLPEAAENDLTGVDIKNNVPSSMEASEHQLNLLKKLSSKELNEAIDRGINYAEEQAIQKLKQKKEQLKIPEQKLDNEHVALIMQCQNFFRHAESLLPTLIEKNKKEGSLVDTNITKLKKELDILVKKKQYSKPLDHEDGAKLLEINMDSRRLFDHYFNFYNTPNAFDDQFTSIRFKLGMDMSL